VVACSLDTGYSSRGHPGKHDHCRIRWSNGGHKGVALLQEAPDCGRGDVFGLQCKSMVGEASRWLVWRWLGAVVSLIDRECCCWLFVLLVVSWVGRTRRIP
jgi:hypothetical protein